MKKNNHKLKKNKKNKKQQIIQKTHNNNFINLIIFENYKKKFNFTMAKFFCEYCGVYLS